MKFFTLEKRSNFLKMPGISTYHSYLFHGHSGRDGQWFPNDAEVDVLGPEPSRLSIIVNRFILPEFAWPGLQPLVSGQLRDSIGVLPFVRFQKADIAKAIYYPWSPGASVSIHPGDLGRGKFFERMDSVTKEGIDERFELQGLQYVAFPDVVRAKANAIVQIEIGTDPFAQTQTLSISIEVLREIPLFFKGMTMIVADFVFHSFETFVDNNFFVVREWAIDS